MGKFRGAPEETWVPGGGIEVLSVCYYHVTYAFQNESTFCSYLNVKELLAQNKHDI